MQLQNFDLNLLKSLDALLTEKSVTNAAERVFLSQPAMSGALRRLRDEFNDQLLVRNGREMELTPLGASLAVSVRDMLQSIQQMLDTQVRFDPATARRSFNFAMTDYAAMVLMPRVLQRLAEEAPYITCNVQGVDEMVSSRVMSGDVDLFVGIRPWLEANEAKFPSGLRAEPLFSDHFSCLVADDNPMIGSTLSLEQYCALPHGLVRFPRQVQSLVESHVSALGLDLKIGVTAANFAALGLMLPHTKLIATVQNRLAEVLARALPLKVLACPIAIPPLEEVLIWHPRAALDPAHDYIRSIFFVSANQIGQPE
ncbi:LysR family transcriptional regulator [soil metagenome]